MKQPLPFLLTSLLFTLSLPVVAATPAPATPVPATPAPATVPVGQSQCFQLQYLLRLPNLEGLHFIRDVESLQSVDENDETTGNLRVAALSAEAAGLRRDEARAFTQLALLLKTMAAPPDLQSWAAAHADSFGKPLPLTKEAQRDSKANPQVVAILATLDEADALKSDTDGHLNALAAWISLTHGTPGLWAGDVGELTAALHVSLTDHEAPRLAADTARRLYATAPASAPASVCGALASLVPSGGNLSNLATVTTVTAAPQTVSQAQETLLVAFAAQSLLAADAKEN